MLRLSRFRFGCLALLTLLVAAPASAQSAADKAAARRLATEGIELHGQGKFTEALDRLQRAQALYDAPVHLLYIARAQTKLGQFVEASETYRRLLRVQLEPGAPAAFRDAVEAAKREVGEVEGKLAELRVDIEPPNIPGLELSIDGQPVPVAILGVERPANPGRHVVSASAPGYLRAEQAVDLAATEKKAVRLTLASDPSAQPAAAPEPGAMAVPDRPSPAGASPPPAPESAPAKTTKSFHVLLGLRLGGAIPSGSVFKLDDEAVAMSDYVTPGAGLELSAGAWFARYFGAKIHIEGYAFTPGESLDNIDGLGFQSTVTNQASIAGAGISLLGGTPLDNYGVFGELGFTFLNEFTISRQFDAESNAFCNDRSFEQTLTFSGAAFRLGAGARLPVSKVFHLTPFALVSFGQFTSLENDNDCSNALEETLGGPGSRLPPSGDFDDEVKAGHRLFFIGLGGEFVLPLR